MFGRRRKDTLKRLLVVEDEPLIAFDHEYLLENAGYDVVDTVARGEEALDVLKDKGVDALVCDVNLAGQITGADVARAARAKGVAVLLVTGSCPDDAHTYADACLTKPFKYGGIVDALHAMEDTRAGRAPGDVQGLVLFSAPGV